MEARFGRFTAKGSEFVEARMSEMAERIAQMAARLLSPRTSEALVLLGGYGRGEGGVVRNNGQEHPHNNLDLLLIAKRVTPRRLLALRQSLEEALEPIEREFGLACDLSAIEARRLSHAACKVMWYDMRFGHKTLYGNPDFVPSLARFTIDNLPAADVTALLVNRGTLLVINDLLLEQRAQDPGARRAVVKHAVKAVIGYGDALLYTLGRYHWSYLEKQRRMRELEQVPQALRQLYDEAMAFRFEPDYESYLARDLTHLMDDLAAKLEPVHLVVEGHRLKKPALEWRDYPEALFGAGLFARPETPRDAARRLINMFRTPAPGGLPLLAKLGVRSGGATLRMWAAFPAVLYRDMPEAERRRAADVLGAADASRAALRRAYLRLWSQAGDANFNRFLTTHGLSIEESPQ